MGSGDVKIPRELWKDHPWLSRIRSLSDLDGDSYLVIFDASPEATLALQEITMEYTQDGQSWTTVRATEGGAFPSADWKIASVSWMWPLDVHHWMNVIPEPGTGAVRWRAVIPEGWTCPSS